MSRVHVLNKTITLIDSAAADLDIQNNFMESGFEKMNKSTLLNMSNITKLYSNINNFGNTILKQSDSIKELLSGLQSIEQHIENKEVNEQSSFIR